MAVGKKTEKTVKKTADPAKKSGGKKTTPARKATAKTTGKSKAAPAKKPAAAKKPVTRKAAVKTAPARKPAAIKPVRKAETKAEKKTDRLAELRKALIIKREAIVREAKEEISKYVSGENRQLVDTALDEGDWAVVDISEDINLRRLDAHRKALHDLDESLRKIKEGTYGICEECGEEISAKRLHVMPTANLCVNCKEKKERLEALESQETL
jgi:DnaK suppressor protein